jgi:hypothetical protein
VSLPGYDAPHIKEVPMIRLWTFPGAAPLGTTLVLVLLALAVPLRAQDTVSVFLKVFDVTTGESVTDLTADEISIQEDGEAREVVDIEPIDWPVKVHLLVDNSSAMSQALIRIRDGLHELVSALPEDVEVEVVTTSPQPRFATRMTGDRAEVSAAIDRIAPDPGASAFVDALVEASDRIEDADDGYFPVVIMIAGNGSDPSGGMDRKLERLQEQTFAQSVTYHFIIWNAQARASATALVQDGLAEQLSQLTGGRNERLSAAERLSSLIPELAPGIASAHQNQRGQMRVTYERPRGAMPQGISANVRRAGAAFGSILTLNGRIE